MLASSKGSGPKVFWPSLLQFAVIDLSATGVAAAAWFGLDLVDAGPAALANLLRVLLWVVHLRRLLTPVSAWQGQGGGGSDSQLLEADGALQRLRPQLTVGYAVGWLGCGLLVVLGSAAASGAIPPRVELMAGVTCVLSVVMSVPVTTRPLFNNLFLDVQTELSGALRERRIEAPRPRASVATQMTGYALLTAAVAISVGGLAKVPHAHSLRDAAVIEQQRRAELSAMRVGAGLGAALEGVEIVERDALPEHVGIVIERRGEAPLVAFYDPRRTHAVAAVALADGRWAIAEAEVEEQLGLFIPLLLALGVFVGLSTWIVAALDGRGLASSIERFSEAARAFVERGELQALERVVPLRDDELGRLATNFRDMLSALEDLASAAKTITGGDLTVEFERPGQLHDAFRAMLAQLHDMVLRIRETSLAVASAATEIHAATQQQDQAAQRQTASVQEVGETIAALFEAAQDITVSAQGVLSNAEQTVDTTRVMVDKIRELSAQAASISELLEVIGEIADRSDLLALNGSLEAVRAGEAGRGFALVAAEMRRLAERVTGTVNDVRERVVAIEASGSGTVMATQRNRELTQSTVEAAQLITEVMGAQSARTEQVVLGVEAAKEMVAAAATATSQTRAAAEGLRAHAAELERLIAAFEVRADTHTSDQ